MITNYIHPLSGIDYVTHLRPQIQRRFSLNPVEVDQRMINCIPDKAVDLITYPYPNIIQKRL